MVDEDQGPGLGQEAARHGLALLAMVVAAVVLAVVERKASDPDAWRTVKMRAAKGAERFCAASAGEWWHLAERARAAYEAERP